MGYWYLRQLETETVMNENAENKYDLPEKGALSGLYIKYQLKNAAANFALDNSWPFQQTTLRVLANGNKEIINVKGHHLEAINWWDTGVMPKNVLWDDNSGVEEAHVFIPFGRYMGDLEYGLLCEKFASGIEFIDKNTVSTTYFTDANMKIDLVALMRKNPEAGLFSKGYLSKVQVKDKNTDSATRERVKLPTDQMLKQIYLFNQPDLSSNVPATTPFTQLDTLWLSIKSREEYIINQVKATIFARYIHALYKRMAETFGITKASSSSDNFFDTQIYERGDTQLTGMDTSGMSVSEDGTTFLERISKLYAWNSGGTRVSKYVYVKANGILYHGLIPLLSIDPKAPETDYLDAKANGDVYVDWKEGASTGNIYLVLDELVKNYPSG